MFRLIKIVNSGTNVPEPCKLPKPISLKIKSGMPLVMSDGKLAACTATDKPAYISISDAPSGSTEAVCYEVNASMHFETVASATPTALNIGKAYTLAIDSDGYVYGITAATTSGVATVVDVSGAKAIGDKITVKFN